MRGRTERFLVSRDLAYLIEVVPGDMEQSLHPWLGCICDSQRSFANSVWFCPRQYDRLQSHPDIYPLTGSGLEI